MKRFLGLLVCAFIFHSCDDGDINLKNFNFDTTAPVNDCSENNGLFFKIKSNEALILEIPLSSFSNDVTPADQPVSLLINSENHVIYRLFSRTVTESYFCSSVPPADPIVSDEWNASQGVEGVSGIIEITTTQIVNPDTQVLLGYNHHIVFKNVTFSNSDNSFVYETYVFGNYVTSI
ncbi:hypothetical protein [Flavobacterium sp. GT3R68]|uniref:hypothetical protein n=1 Tax=Flavobacterium sp. GT3R68 TaxID=2594437 RepID=UPI000F89C58A|nr:hypothetical protein [Flavobacterium sp. GT3R68]RTY95202.1 hypothetical protein EKL32_07165 [Flavobacterium sp. GSN2]TRW91055.1 hypothetical protein FNW07_09500 [Flavobacterium sp. GT3R68]